MSAREPTLLIVGAKRRGRQRVEEPSIAVASWIRVSEYDRLARLASEHDVSVSKLVRVAIRRLTREGPL